jgi:hypothetical protein
MNQKDFQTRKKESVTSELFDRIGNPVINKKERTYAKRIVTEGSNSAHYIQTFNNALYDPNNSMYSHREGNINFELKYKKVSKETFDFYMLFLKTKNNLYFTRAQRSFLND